MIFVPALYPTTQKAMSVQLSSFLIPVKAEVMPDRIAYQKFNWGPNWAPTEVSLYLNLGIVKAF